MKLNLGCGVCPINGYVNLDGSNGDCIYPLGYSNVDEIRASHVLEHFGIDESVDVLTDWVGALAVGGRIKIAVPDFDDLIRRYQIGAISDIEVYVMGSQNDQCDYHKSLWTYPKLSHILSNLGIKNIRSWQSEIIDCAIYPFSLNLMGEKI